MFFSKFNNAIFCLFLVTLTLSKLTISSANELNNDTTKFDPCAEENLNTPANRTYYYSDFTVHSIQFANSNLEYFEVHPAALGPSSNKRFSINTFMEFSVFDSEKSANIKIGKLHNFNNKLSSTIKNCSGFDFIEGTRIEEFYRQKGQGSSSSIIFSTLTLTQNETKIQFQKNNVGLSQVKIKHDQTTILDLNNSLDMTSHLRLVPQTKATKKNSSQPAQSTDPAEVTDLLNFLSNVSNSVSDRIEAARYVAKFPFKDVAESLIKTLAREVEQSEVARKIDYKLVENLIYAVGESATLSEYKGVEKLFARLTKLNEAIPLSFSKSIESFTSIDSEIDIALTKIAKKRPEELPRLPETTTRNWYKDSKNSSKDISDRFRTKISSELVGQTHVVDQLTKIFERDRFYGFRDKPEFMWFLGPAGTGKDTAAQAYLSAIHNNPEAYLTHLYKIDPLQHDGDLWALLGSATGYVGSGEMPPLFQFIKSHSGGRYIIEEVKGDGGKATFKIVNNEKWKSGQIVPLPGYSTPDQGVIYLPNFQSWSENFKNSLIKMSLEYNGYWKINNPNGGLSEIYCPLTIIAASDNGAELVTSREQNGQRFGKPLTYEEIKIKSDVVRNDPLKLRQSILGANPSARNAGQNSKGTSESFLNLIPDDRLIYFDPLSPKDLQTIAENKLQLLKKEIARSKSGFQHVNLMWTPSVITFLQEYKYQAEAQGRPIEAKLRAMIENTLIQLFSNTDVVPKDTPVDLTLDVKKQEDKSWKLVINGIYTDDSKTQKSIFHEMYIEPTLVDRDQQPLTDAQIDKLKEIPGKLKKQIIGQQHALERIGKVILLNQEGRHIHVTADEAVHPAQIVTLFGPTSTGKTETSKVIAELTGGTRSSAVPVDCSSLQTADQLMERIFGKVSSDGEIKKSDFMKTFDRNNGHVVLVLDELANVKDKDILTVLFDLFREATVSSFADRVPRVVSNVVIVITGNASQEILAQLPKDIPEDVKREVWADIYNRLEVDHDFRRTVLEKYLTPPMIARLGEDNIFFYKPLSYSEVRELTQMKFNQMITSFEAPVAGLRRWKIRIPSEKDYTSIIAALDTNGFKLEEQGASIETYIQKGLYKEIRETLLLNHVPDNDTVQLRLKNISLAKLNSGIKYKKLNFEATTSSGRKLGFALNGKIISHDIADLPQNTLATSAHEVGHTINKLALLSSVETPTEIRILPGLTMIDGNWIYYSGIATSRASAQAEVTREYLLREVATLLGGTVAENLVVVGGMDSAGRKNDLERATQILENWILKYGMSKSFGLAVLNKSDLSSRDKMRLNTEVQKLLKEAKVLSERSIIANKELFIALSNELAKKGQLNSHDIQHAVMKHGLTKEADRNFNTKVIQNESSFNGIENADHHGLNYRFVADLGLLPLDQVIDTTREIQKQKLRDQKSVPTPDNAPIVGRVIKTSGVCADLLSNKTND